MNRVLKIYPLLVLGFTFFAGIGVYAESPVDAEVLTDSQKILKAEQLFTAGQYRQANELLDTLKDQNKTPLFRAKLLMADKQYDRAAAFYRDLIERGLDHQLDLAECLYELERYAEALEVYKRVRSSKNMMVWVTYKTLLCHLLLSDWLAADQTLKGLTFTADHPGFYFGQAAYRFAQNKTDEALYFIHSAEQLYDDRDIVRFLQPLFQQLWLLPEESTLQKIN